MLEKINTNCWLLVIDTDSYSGNFERELTAYLTGQVGECGVGSEMVRIFDEDAKTNEPPVNFDDEVFAEADDAGCARPCTIFPTPGWYNDGMGRHYQVGDETEALKTYRMIEEDEINRGKAHYEGYLKNMPPGWTKEAVQRELKGLERRLVEVKKLKKVPRYPAYQSVAILFSKKPSEKTVEWLKERAKGYPEARKKVCPWDRSHTHKITGWRLVKNDVIRRQKQKTV